MPSQTNPHLNGTAVGNGDSHPNIVRSTQPLPDYPNVSLSEYISGRISKHPKDALAFIDPNNNYQLTYGQLHLKVHQLAVALLKLNLQSTDFLMFYADNSLEYCVLVLSAVYLGLPYCPVPPASGAFELTEQIKGANGSVLIFGANKLTTIEKVLQEEKYSATIANHITTIIEMDVDEGEEVHSLLKQHPLTKSKVVCSFAELESLGIEKQLSTVPHFPIADPSTSTYLVCFTSGTTGKPKAAVHTHRSMLYTLINAKIGLNEFGFRTALYHPIGHISGSLMLPHALDIGMTIVLFKEGNIDQIMETVPRLGINCIFFSPDMASPLVLNEYEKQYDLSSLVSLKTGGSRIADNLLRGIKEKYGAIYEMYGATEMMCAVRTKNPDDTSINYVPGNCGTVMPGVEMKIIDLSTGEPLPAYQTGEVCFRGGGVFAGYLNNPEATASTIDSEGFYHSGDIGYYDDQGRLFISDRIKEMIKYKLYSLIPAEIEDFLHRHKAVAAVCIVGVPHASEGYYIRAYVELVSGETATEEELIRYVAENMGTQKRLRAGVRFIDAMPRTLIGKIDRQYFKKLVANELITELVL